ncbi:MAG: transglutaminase family protein, partial [Planctomycetota bacterium]
MLGDDRGPIQAEARERLLRWGELAVPQLREGAEAERVRTRARCRAVLRALDVRDCLRRFARLRIGRSARGSAPALLEGAVLLSSMVRTFVPAAAELAARLRREANELRREFAGRSLPTCARLLAERLHDHLGLHGLGPEGGVASVLDLDHVLIDRVLRQRIGVPVSLSLIYVLVARWAGLAATGVALPDHFLVRLHGVRPVLVDP